MKQAFFILLAIMASAAPSQAEEEKSGYLHIAIENKSAFPTFLQVRDDVCAINEDEECEAARLSLKSKTCQENYYAKECKKARKKLKGSSCKFGRIYEGMVDSGEIIEVSICKSSADYGRISIRAPNKNSTWKRYLLIGDGDELSYP